MVGKYWVKMFSFCFLCIFIFLIDTCCHNELAHESTIDRNALKEKIYQYKIKLEDLLGNSERENPEMSNYSINQPHHIQYLDNTNFYYPEDFAVYFNLDKPKEAFGHVFLYEYYDFIVLLLSYIEDESNIPLNEYFTIDTPRYETNRYMLQIDDNKTIIKKVAEQEKESVMIDLVDNILQIKSIQYNVSNEGKLIYNYVDFYEGHYTVLINSLENCFTYDYYSENSYEIYRYSYDPNNKETGTVYVSWYNPETNIVHGIGMTDDTVNYEYLEVLDEYGFVFAYSLNCQEQFVNLSWNLIETTGWDYVYVDDADAFYGQILGYVYQDDVDLFNGQKVNITLSENDANIGINKSFTLDEVNDDVINLNEYGLQLNDTSITLDYITIELNYFKNNYKSVNNYSHFDFFNGNNIADQFLSFIDPQLIMSID